MTYDVLIIGAGPAGLTAAYELSKQNKNIITLEMKSDVGGLAQSKVFGEYTYDIGPHRFFTKNEEVNDLFLNMLGEDAVLVDRKTRILFKGKYFDYPLTPINALFGLGFFDSISILFSYLYARLKSSFGISKINNFEDWVIDKFGKKLYLNFFKNYTEKVWGIDCNEIGKDWAAQRIKGLNLFTAIKFAVFPNSKSRPKTLVNEFYYPLKGAGMLWQKFETYLIENGIKVQKNSRVSLIKRTNFGFDITYEDENNMQNIIKAKNIFFSNPLLNFLDSLDEKLPQEVLEAANSLHYRNHISVHLTVDKKLFDDNWIYIHSPDLNLARISDFSNFSDFMSPNGTYPLTLEYFCFQNDEVWNDSKDNVIQFAIEELKKIFPQNFNILHSDLTLSPKAYPVIRSGYEKHINIIKDWLQTQDNLTAIGRSGMFKYNNQDHAMATGLYAARNYLGNGKFDPWMVNVDGEYHEENKTIIN